MLLLLLLLLPPLYPGDELLTGDEARGADDVTWWLLDGSSLRVTGA